MSVGRKSARHVPLAPERRALVAERLRAARAQAGLTQEALAEASSVGTEHIQRMERGAANPTLATLYALADALQVEARALLPD